MNFSFSFELQVVEVAMMVAFIFKQDPDFVEYEKRFGKTERDLTSWT